MKMTVEVDEYNQAIAFNATGKKLGMIAEIKLGEVVEIHNGSTGNGHSAHPNIDTSGSVKGMKAIGYWGQHDVIASAHGNNYNMSKLVISDDLDKLAYALEQNPSQQRFVKSQIDGLKEGLVLEITVSEDCGINIETVESKEMSMQSR